MDIRALTIVQRQDLLEAGLQERSEEVRKDAIAMTTGWLGEEREKEKSNDTSTIQGGIAMLLRSLNIEEPEGETVGCIVVRELHRAGVLQLPEMDFLSLNPETSLLWRVVCECWRDNKVSSWHAEIV